MRDGTSLCGLGSPMARDTDTLAPYPRGGSLLVHASVRVKQTSISKTIRFENPRDHGVV